MFWIEWLNAVPPKSYLIHYEAHWPVQDIILSSAERVSHSLAQSQIARLQSQAIWNLESVEKKSIYSRIRLTDDIEAYFIQEMVLILWCLERVLDNIAVSFKAQFNKWELKSLGLHEEYLDALLVVEEAAQRMRESLENRLSEIREYLWADRYDELLQKRNSTVA